MRLIAGLAAIVALAWAIALQPEPPRRLTLGAPGDEPAAYGFWSGERNAEGAYRWSDDESWLRAFGYGAADGVALSLRLIGPQGSRGQTTTLRLSAGDLLLLEGASPASWRTYHLLLPPAGPGYTTPELRVGGATTSATLGDGRAVGVAIGAVGMAPLGGPRPLAVAEYAAFAALLMALAWAGAARAVGPTAGLGAALALGAALLMWRRLDPAGAAFWLPPLWGAVLLPGGALAALWLHRRLAPRLAGSLAALSGGLAAGLAGAALLWAQVAPLGGALLLAGALVAAAALAGRDAGPPAPAAARGLWPYGLAILGCCLLALGLRLYRLDEVPFGLWRDDARYGLIAMRILEDPGYRPVFVPQLADTPALLFYFQALTVGALGPTVGALRAVPAVAGGLTVLAIALLAGQIWGRAAALWAAGLLAVAAWHITLSRLAFPAILDPLFTLVSLALIWRIGTGRARGWQLVAEGAGAGVALGLAIYTYHPARLMPLVAAIWVALLLGRSAPAWRRAAPGLLALAAAALLTVAPMIAFWVTNPGGFNQRVGQVSLLDRESEKRAISVDLDRNLSRYALMWHVEGDFNGRHNVPRAPMLDPLTGVLFLTGMITLAAGRPTAARYPLLTLLAVGLLPGLLSTDAPHAVRVVDAIAPAVLIAAFAAAPTAGALAGWPRLRAPILAAAAAGLLLFNGWSYFGRVPYDPRIWEAFRYPAETMISRTIHEGRCAGPALVPQAVARSDVLRYMTTGSPVEAFDPASPPPRFPAGACVYIPADLPPDQLALLERRLADAGPPEAPWRYPGTDQPVFWLYRAP